MLKKIVSVTIFLFISLFIFIAAGAFLVGCNVSVRGSGNVIEEGREVSGFDRVALDGMGEVILEQGETHSLVVEADDNLMQYIKSTVRGDQLTINIKSKRPIIPTKGLKFYVTVPNLEAVSVDGAGSVNISSLEAETLELDINGSGNISVDELEATALVIGVDGVGDIDVAGEVNSLEVDINGSGSFNGKHLESDVANVDIDGVGNAKIHANDSLDANVDGVGQVVYYGNPTVSQNVNGLGRVVHR